MTGSALTLILIVIGIGALPTWPYSGNWTFVPSGICTAVLAGVVALMTLGQLS